jgi:hypothetical protein
MYQSPAFPVGLLNPLPPFPLSPDLVDHPQRPPRLTIGGMPKDLIGLVKLKATWLTLAALMVGLLAGSLYGFARAEKTATSQHARFEMRIRCTELFKDRDPGGIEVVDYSPELNTCLDAEEVAGDKESASFIRDISGRTLYTHSHANTTPFDGQDAEMEKVFAELTGTTGTVAEHWFKNRNQ